MLRWLFTKKPPEPPHGHAQRGEDSVWMSMAAQRKGIAKTVDILVEAEQSVLVVVLSASALDAYAGDLVRFAPLRCAEIFARQALLANIAKAGAVTIASVQALPPDALPLESDGLDIIVAGRHRTREEDDRIAAFADSLGRTAHLTFHLALDDPLLAQFGDRLAPLLAKLGATADEPIEHAMITRAIENAQRKPAR